MIHRVRLIAENGQEAQLGFFLSYLKVDDLRPVGALSFNSTRQIPLIRTVIKIPAFML